MTEIFITKKGFEKLQLELKKFQNEEKIVIQAIAEARELRELSENAEYKSAKERQGFITNKIKLLKSYISSAKIIDSAHIADKSVVRFGATVMLKNEQDESIAVYKIVGIPESNIDIGYISIASPFAKALIGKKVQNIVSVDSPSGRKEYTIVSIEYT